MVSYGFVLKWNMQTGIHLALNAQLASDKTKTQMLQITSNINKLCYPHLNESTIDVMRRDKIQKVVYRSSLHNYSL